MSYCKRRVFSCCNRRDPPEPHDIDEIIDSHIVHGRVVERLKI